MRAGSLVVERIVRESYGRLVATLAARGGDVAAAEDALSEALAAALTRWPVDGVPDNPEAWLYRVARHKGIDEIRKNQTRLAQADALADAAERSRESSSGAIEDRRLDLMFACTHDAIAASVRPALILQTVLGLDAATISNAMLVPPATLSQRLVRAKSRIKALSIPFEIPPRSRWRARIASVHEAIYGAFTSGSLAWDDSDHRQLSSEAIWLAEILCELVPDDPESHGLLALMLYSESRRPARVVDGCWIPLPEQDPARWNRELIERAELELRRASASGEIGPYQLEAAIQSMHARRVFGEQPDWRVLVQFYEALVALSPTTGAITAMAAALWKAGEPERAHALLLSLPSSEVHAWQPFWVVQACVLQALGRPAEASDAHQRAVGLTSDPLVRAWLLKNAPASRPGA